MSLSIKTYIILATALICFCALFITSISIGSFDTSVSNVWNSIFNYEKSNLTHFSIVHLRMPRILLAFMVGACLASSGYLMQVTINNPLAEPYILGTSSAASLGANLVFFGLIPISILGIYMPPVVAFGMAIVCTFIVITIAKTNSSISGAKILLAGIAMSSLLVSIVSILAFMADSNEKLRTIIFWVMGSFEHAKWNQILLLFVILLVVSILSIPYSKHINLLMLGQEKAEDLGLNSKLYYRITLVIAVFLASISVTFAGAIGFVGLIIPHFIRSFFGTTNKYNIIFSVLIGGLFMMMCEFISKVIYPPMGIPIGIITSLFGVPFFVYLLLKRNYTFD